INVRDISGKENALILEITRRLGTDYVVYRYEENLESVTISGERAMLKGTITLFQISPKSRRQLSTIRRTSNLKSFGSNYLTLSGELDAKPGQTAILQHADGHTTAF